MGAGVRRAKIIDRGDTVSRRKLEDSLENNKIAQVMGWWGDVSSRWWLQAAGSERRRKRGLLAVMVNPGDTFAGTEQISADDKFYL